MCKVQLFSEILMFSSPLLTLIQRVPGHLPRGPRAGRSPRLGHWRPTLEILEHRTAPATVTWTNPAGGAWENPANWSTGSLPGPGDDVLIANLNPEAVIAHTSDTIIHQLTSTVTNPASIFLNSGSLAFDGPSTLSSATRLVFNGGILGGLAT
jgi:hypothetical protein